MIQSRVWLQRFHVCEERFAEFVSTSAAAALWRDLSNDDGVVSDS